MTAPLQTIMKVRNFGLQSMHTISRWMASHPALSRFAGLMLTFIALMLFVLWLVSIEPEEDWRDWD